MTECACLLCVCVLSSLHFIVCRSTFVYWVLSNLPNSKGFGHWVLKKMGSVVQLVWLLYRMYPVWLLGRCGSVKEIQILLFLVKIFKVLFGLREELVFIFEAALSHRNAKKKLIPKIFFSYQYKFEIVSHLRLQVGNLEVWDQTFVFS